MRVPAFLVRRFYVPGSLRNTSSGFSLQAHNDVGQGMLVGVRGIRVDGAEVPRDAITATRDGIEGSVNAADISRTNPVSVRRGERVTLHVEGHHLAPGTHHLEVELIERDLGLLQLAIKESVRTESEPPADEAPADEAPSDADRSRPPDAADGGAG